MTGRERDGELPVWERPCRCARGTLPPVRVLAVADHLGALGGLERTQLTNCRGLARRGHRLDVVYVSSGDLAGQWREAATTMIEVPGTLPRRARPVRSSAGWLAAVRSGAAARPDVVYVYHHFDLPYAAAVRAVSGAAVVPHLCLPPPARLLPFIGPSLAAVDAAVAVSRDTAQRWVAMGLPADRVTVAPTAVDLTRYRPAVATERADARRRLGVGDDTFVVLFAGRIAPEKGVDTLVRAFARLAAVEPDSHLVVAGGYSNGTDPAASRAYEAAVRAQAQRWPVDWVGRQQDVVPLLWAADVAVVPSRWPEPLARSVLEPLATGVPVVATSVGGTPEAMTGWLADWMVAPDDPVAMADRLLDVRDRRRRDPGLGGRCRQAALARPSLDDELDLIEAAMTRGRERRSTRRPRRRRRWPAADAGAPIPSS